MGEVFNAALSRSLSDANTAPIAIDFLHRLAHAAELLEGCRLNIEAAGCNVPSADTLVAALPLNELFAVSMWHEFEPDTLPTLGDLVHFIPAVTERARTAPSIPHRWPFIHFLWHLRNLGAREVVKSELKENLDFAGEPAEARYNLRR